MHTDMVWFQGHPPGLRLHTVPAVLARFMRWGQGESPADDLLENPTSFPLEPIPLRCLVQRGVHRSLKVALKGLLSRAGPPGAAVHV